MIKYFAKEYIQFEFQNYLHVYFLFPDIDPNIWQFG